MWGYYAPMVTSQDKVTLRVFKRRYDDFIKAVSKLDIISRYVDIPFVANGVIANARYDVKIHDFDQISLYNRTDETTHIIVLKKGGGGHE